MARRDIVGGLEKDGDGAELFGAWFGGVALSGLELQHEHQPRRQRALQNRVEPWSRDRVGQIRHDLERRGEFDGKGGARELHRVARLQVKMIAKFGFEGFREVGRQGFVVLYRPEVGAGFEQSPGEGAQAGAHLHDVVPRPDFRESDRFLDDVAIDEKVLSESSFRQMAESDE